MVVMATNAGVEGTENTLLVLLRALLPTPNALNRTPIEMNSRFSRLAPLRFARCAITFPAPYVSGTGELRFGVLPAYVSKTEEPYNKVILGGAAAPQTPPLRQGAPPPRTPP